MAEDISLDEQVKAVGREIGLRKAVYPKLIGSGRMAEAAAAIEIRRMEAVYATLKRLASLYDAIVHGDEAHRAWLKAKIEQHFKGA